MKRYFYLLALIALTLAACSRHDSAGLLSTVPRDAETVTVFDIKSLSSDLGDEGRALITEIIDRGEKSGHRLPPEVAYLLSEDSQADFSAPAVTFQSGGSSITTFYLKDEGRFRKDIEACTGKTFSSTGKVYALDGNTVFTCEGQAWMTAEYPEVTAADIAVFTQLKEADCIMALECGPRLEGKGDMLTLVNLDRLLEGSWNRTYRMILSMVIDDASYIFSTTDFEKGKMTNETLFLNHKNEPTNLALKLKKIDTGKLKEFTGKGNAFLALGVEPSMMHSLVRQAKMFGIVPSDIQDVLEQLDGNIVISADVRDKYEDVPPLCAMFTFKSAEAASKSLQTVQPYIDAFMPDSHLFTDDKRLYIVYSSPEGSDIGGMKDELKGATLGLTLLPSFFQAMGGPHTADYIRGVNFRVTDDSKGARIETQILTPDDRNALPALLQMIAN